MLEHKLDSRNVSRSIFLVVTILILLGSIGSTEASVYSSLLIESQTTVSSPEVILQNGTAGTSTIYANGTSAKASVIAPVYLDGWDERVEITIDHNDIDSDIPDFPVLVYLSSSSGRNNDDVTFVFDEVGSNSKKIAVTTSDGTTECYVEIEKWNATSEQAWLWVKVPSINNTVDTDLYLYYDINQPDNTNYVGDTNSTAAENVWDTNFKAVHHFEGTSGSEPDSTSNDNDATVTGATRDATGKIGPCHDLDGDDDRLLIPNSTSLDVGNQFTAEEWVKWEGSTPNRDRIWDRKTVYNGPDGWHISLAADDTDYNAMGSGGTYTDLAIVDSWTAGEWHCVVTIFNGTTARTYSDGSFKDDVTIDSVVDNDLDLLLGEYGGGAGYNWDGKFDEFRLSDSMRSAAWIKASYESERDDLLDFGSEDYEDYVDNNTSNVDNSDPEDKGTHSNFTAQQYGPDSVYDTLTEEDVGGGEIVDNSENFVDNNSSTMDGVEYGSHSNFTAQQYYDSINDTLTEEDTTSGGGVIPYIVNYTSAEVADAVSISVDKPSGGQSGDIYVVWISCDGTSPDPTEPTGFTAFATFTGASGVIFDSAYRVYDGTEGSTFTYDWSAGNNEHAVMACFLIRNANTSDIPHKRARTSGSGSPITFPSVTTEKDNCLLLRCASMDDDDDPEPVGTVPSGHTNLVDRTTNPATGSATGLACNMTQQSAGNNGTADWTHTSGEGWHCETLAFSPSGSIYELDLEVQWTTLDYDETYEELCINMGANATEALEVHIWNTTASDWDPLLSDLNANTWNNVSISSYLTTTNITIRFKGSSESSDSIQNSWEIECSLIHVWSTQPNQELDLEVQWTNARYNETYEELCVYAGTLATEDIKVDVWNGTGWENIFNDLDETSWNNASITDWLTTSNFTIRFKGGNETGDATQSSWNIDAAFLHVWTPRTFDYFLRVNNNITDSWQIRLKKYSDFNITRLQNCTIYFHNSTDGTSSQIYIQNGSYINQTGPWYDLGDSETIYIAMTVQANSTGTSYVRTYLEILVPDTTTYAQYVITFEIT